MAHSAAQRPVLRLHGLLRASAEAESVTPHDETHAAQIFFCDPTPPTAGRPGGRQPAARGRSTAPASAAAAGPGQGAAQLPQRRSSEAPPSELPGVGMVASAQARFEGGSSSHSQLSAPPPPADLPPRVTVGMSRELADWLASLYLSEYAARLAADHRLALVRAARRCAIGQGRRRAGEQRAPAHASPGSRPCAAV